MKQFGSFDVEEYRKRLRLLRKLYDENQQQFADRLGIPFKRWNHYERGYPIPRETAFILHEKVQGISTDWIWFGREGNLTADLRSRLQAAEHAERKHPVRAMQQERIRTLPTSGKKKISKRRK